MLNTRALQGALQPALADAVFSNLAAAFRHWPTGAADLRSANELLDDNTLTVEWSEEDIVFLHWRLLQEIGHLADPDQPLDEKIDTLRWVFTERDKDAKPFSFVSCLCVVGCSPLSPIAYCGSVDAQEIRDRIQHSLNPWLSATLGRYPAWVREAVIQNPELAATRLARKPQCISKMWHHNLPKPLSGLRVTQHSATPVQGKTITLPTICGCNPQK